MKGRKKSGKNFNSTSDKKCFRCENLFSKEHLKNCPAKDIECNFCGLTGHFAKYCGKAGKLPGNGKNYHSANKKDEAKKSIHTLQVTEDENSVMDFYDEKGNLRVYPKEG